MNTVTQLALLARIKTRQTWFKAIGIFTIVIALFKFFFGVYVSSFLPEKAVQAEFISPARLEQNRNQMLKNAKSALKIRDAFFEQLPGFLAAQNLDYAYQTLQKAKPLQRNGAYITDPDKVWKSHLKDFNNKIHLQYFSVRKLTHLLWITNALAFLGGLFLLKNNLQKWGAVVILTAFLLNLPPFELLTRTYQFHSLLFALPYFITSVLILFFKIKDHFTLDRHGLIARKKSKPDTPNQQIAGGVFLITLGLAAIAFCFVSFDAFGVAVAPAGLFVVGFMEIKEGIQRKKAL